MRNTPTEILPAQKSTLSEIEPSFASWLYMSCPEMPISSQRGESPALKSHILSCRACFVEWTYVLTLRSFEQYTR